MLIKCAKEVISGKKSQIEIAKEYGMTKTNLIRWIKNYQKPARCIFIKNIEVVEKVKKSTVIFTAAKLFLRLSKTINTLQY